MMKLILKLISGSLFLLLAGSINAQQKYELTVKEAVDLALKNVTEFKNAQLDYRIQEAKNKEIKGQALPQLSGNVSANHYLQLPKFLFPDATSTAIYSILKEEGVTGVNGPITKVPEPTLQQVSFQQPWNLATGATLSQLLFQPDIFVALQARQTSLEYYTSLVDQAKDKIKDSAYKRYYAILVVEKQLHFLNENIKRLEKLYHDDSVMYKNGFAEKLDMDKVQVQLNNVKSMQSVLQNSVQLAYAALKFALGLTQSDTIVLKDNLTAANIRENIMSEGFQYDDRPEIRSLDFIKKLQELDTKRNRLSKLPTVSLMGNYSLNAMGQKFYTDKNTVWLKSSFIGLNVNVPIFDGFQRRYKVQQSQLTMQKIENTAANVKRAIDLEQYITRESLKNALLNLDIQERNIALAEKVYNTTKLKFEEGLGNSFEVLQADTDYQTAQSGYFTALYNAVIAKTSYLKSLGKLE